MSMEIKKSTPVRITGNGTWESQYGLFYKFEIEMQNGDIGEYSSKSQDQNKFVQGQETEYEWHTRISNGRTFHNIKPVKQEFQPNRSGGGFQKSTNPDRDVQIVRQSSLNRATDLCINGKIELADVLVYAEVFVNYVQSGAKAQSNNPGTQETIDQIKDNAEKKSIVQNGSDGLPF